MNPDGRQAAAIRAIAASIDTARKREL